MEHPTSADEGRAEDFLRILDVLFMQALSGAGDSRDMLQAALDAGMRIVDGHRGFVAMVNYQTGELRVACISGEGWDERCRPLRLHLGQETDRGITGHVALEGRPYVCGDVDNDPYYLRYHDDVRSEIAVPILGPQGQTRGVITIDSLRPNAFDAEDCAHLAAIAHTAAVGLALDGFRARESALIEIGRSLSATLDTDAICQSVVLIAEKVLRYDNCSVFLADEMSQELVLRATCCAADEHAIVTRYAMGEGLTGWVAAHGAPVRLENPTQDPRWKRALANVPESEVGPFLAVPIISRDRVLGVIRVMRRKSHTPWYNNRFTESDERVLSIIASQVGAAVENARSFDRLLRAERMAAWGELSAKSAHMIGNRVFALKGHANELRHVIDSAPHMPQCDEIRQLLAGMEDGLQQLDELLREFRDFVVATQVTLAPGDVAAILKETIAETFPRRSPVKLRTEIAEGLPSVRCDARRLKRAFAELIENALSFQPEGGRLDITCRLATEEEKAEARLATARGYVRIVFQDEGPGVPPEIRDRIFQPFFTSRVRGMGLGLSIVKGIVEAHHGIIREVGRPGEGARFVIDLPVDDSAPASRA